MNAKQIFVIAIIAMFMIVPFASAKQESVDVAKDTKQDKKIEEKAVDKTKEQPKEVKNKDKDITGKITVTDSDISDYSISKESKSAIKIKKDGEHTKAKVTISKEEIQKIDEDGDKLYGILHIADDGSTTHDVVTESELIAGTEMVFSENIVNGYTGYFEKTQTGVTSGTIIDIPDVSGSDYYVTTSVNGSVPTYTPGIPIDGLYAKYEADEGTGNVLHDSSGNNRNLTFTNATWDSNGKGGYALVFNGYTRAPFRPVFGYQWTIYSRHRPTNTSTVKRLLTLSTSTSTTLMSLYSDPNEVTSFAARNTTPTLKIVSNTATSDAWKSISGTVDNTSVKIYSNGVMNQEKSMVTPLTTSYTNTSSWIGNGAGTSFTEVYYGKLDSLYIYTRSLSASENAQTYAGGSGISFRPVPSYNFTPYDVAAGVEKIIDTDNTCTGIEYIDTTGGTHTITVRIYFTEDITKTTETKGAVYQNVSIIHTKQNATASVGTIVYELDPLYSGAPALSSNNTNATVSRNETHAVISTGLVKQGQSFSYAVSVPDNHDHGFHLGNLMKWVGTGWDFVSTAPEDWDDYIGDQIEVTVS